MKTKFNTTLKEQLQRKIIDIQLILLDPVGFEYEKCVINLDSLDLSNKQLKQETSRSLILRQVQAAIDVDNNFFSTLEQIEPMALLIDQDIVALVDEFQLCRVFEITRTDLDEMRDSGLLLHFKNDLGCMYDWNQVRKLFGKTPESISNPKRSALRRENSKINKNWG